MSARPIGVGVIGLGFMGRTHVGAYLAADAAGFSNRLVAVCDSDPQRRAGIPSVAGNLRTGAELERLFDPRQVRPFERPEELLADPEVELVSICTHTSTHVELALAALGAGKHVLVEKPLALSSLRARPLAAAAAESRRLCMPAMCMRFWPAWQWLQRQVAAGELGRVRSATFRRLGCRPGWASSFYSDPAQSGGALFDLHVHDADFVRWCFGEPASVASTGTFDHLTTLYHYPEGPAHVVAEGGWDHAEGWSFEMAYTAVFDEATADFRFGRAGELQLVRGGERRTVELPQITGYDGEVRHLLRAIESGSTELAATVDDAVAHLRLIEAERESLRSRSVVPL
jgi:predicted dehydrogenase